MTNIMAKTKNNSYDYEWAKERYMLRGLLSRAMEFYKSPKNRKAFEEWKKNKEENLWHK